jgi:hypothetical protein
VDREVLAGDASAGLALIFGTTRLTATYTIRSKDFEAQREAAQFGSVSIAFRF